MDIIKETKEEKQLEVNIKTEAEFIVASVILGILYYVAYFLKFPNTYTIFVYVIFLAALIKDFNNEKGIDVLIYLIMFSIIILPLMTFIQGNINIYLISSFVIAMTALVFAIIGLRNMRKFGFYLTIILFGFSLISTIYLMIPFFKAFNGFSTAFLIQLIRNLSSIALLVLSITYLTKSRGYFKNGN